MKRLDADKAGDVPGAGDNSINQVISSNLDADYFSCIDPNFVSGTWLLPPVPSVHGHLPSVGGDLDDQGVQDEHDEEVAGDRYQVPADGHHHFSSDASSRSEPAQNPLYNSTLVQAAIASCPMMLNNTMSPNIEEHFTLASNSNYTSTYTQCQAPFENNGLMQLLSCTNMHLD